MLQHGAHAFRLSPFAPQIKKALQQCANQLSKKLAKRQARALCPRTMRVRL